MDEMYEVKDKPLSAATRGGSGIVRPFGRVDPIALSALMLSVVMALINAYFVLRHAEIVVTPPKQVLLYIDGDTETGTASLVAAVRMPMVNTSGQDHGDLLSEAKLSLAQGTSFLMESAIEPVFVDKDQETSCEVGFRCVRHGQLFVKQDYNAVFDLPGGQASARYISFPVHSFNCQGDQSVCKYYSGVEASLDALPDQFAQIEVHLSFVGDGERVVACELEEFSKDLRQAVLDYGWLALDCTNGVVTGDPCL